MAKVERLSARSLRYDLGERNLQRASHTAHEVTFGRIASVVYSGDHEQHGNFLAPSYRRLLADPEWAARLDKTYTGSAQLPRAKDRRRGELECAVSSDALLMNVFCYPGILRRSAVCACLGVDAGLRPHFGVRAQLAMRNGEVDRTELDMVLGDLCVEAKLTESGFGKAGRERLLRYVGVEEMFDLDELPRGSTHVLGYQVVRGLMAASQYGRRYLALLDSRRCDLVEICFRVLCAVRDAEVRSRFRLVTWQEIARTLPAVPQRFLAEKYGIKHP